MLTTEALMALLGMILFIAVFVSVNKMKRVPIEPVEPA